MLKLENNFSLYIHIPFCFSKCEYCDFFSIPCHYISDDYVKALCNEILFRFSRLREFNSNVKINTIYIGGGTPSLLTTHQFEYLCNSIKKTISISEECEFTVEVNPDDVSKELLHLFEDLGVNRISCGIQSMNDLSLKFVKRRADENKNIKALNLFDKFWRGQLSLDMIAGLPFETENTFENGLKQIISYNPNHISLYTLTLEEGTELYKKIDNGEIDYDFDFSDKLWLIGKSLLEENQYSQYEVSNFSRKGFECKHNMSYWHHKSYLGCGSGGTGTIYCNKIAFRYTNITEIEKYISFWTKETIDSPIFNLPLIFKTDIHQPLNLKNTDFDFQYSEIVDEKTSEFEFFMMGLRTLEGVSSENYERIFSKKINQNFCNLMENWKDKGLAEIRIYENDIIYSLNSKGILFLNKFLEDLEL